MFLIKDYPLRSSLWYKLLVIHYHNKTQGFNKINITSKTIDRLYIYFGKLFYL